MSAIEELEKLLDEAERRVEDMLRAEEARYNVASVAHPSWHDDSVEPDDDYWVDSAWDWDELTGPRL